MELMVILFCGIITISTAQSPGDPITYTCSTTGGTIHVWRGTAFTGQCSSNSPADEIVISTLSGATDEVGESLSCGIFTATVTSNTGGVSSELTFTASVDLDGLTVMCAGGDFSTTIQVFRPVCPGDVITYTCSTASPSNTHVWTGTAFSGQCSSNNPPDAISVSTLVQDTNEVGESLSCGVFTVTVTNVTSGITSELTFTASVDLDGLTLQCNGGDFITTTVQVFAPPVFPDSVVQDRSQDREDRTTVINWQPANLSRGGVTYDTTAMTDDDVTVMIADHTQTTAVVTVPQFNVPYSVCIEAFDDCRNSSGTPRCTAVIIEAEAPVISNFTTELTCSNLRTVDLVPQEATVVWTENQDRVGNKLRPPVTMAMISCNGAIVHLPPTATQFSFSSTDHPECFSSSQAEFTLTLMNGVGQVMTTESVAVYSIAIPEPLIDNDGTASIPLNRYCSEDPTSFILIIDYKLPSTDEIITVVSGFDSNSYGFKFTFPDLDPSVEFEYDVIIFYNERENGRIKGITATSESDISLAVTVPILSVIIVVLVALLITTNAAWYYSRKKASKSQTVTSIEVEAKEMPVYEDVAELPLPTDDRDHNYELHTEQNQAYGPV